MSVRIDESGSEHGAGAIDLSRIRQLSTEIFLRTDGSDAFVIDANRPPFLDTGIGHLTGFARARRSRTGGDLRGVDEEYHQKQLRTADCGSASDRGLRK